ncbi:MAG: ATP-binding protein [Eggerthellaceae bacterium]|nr:ATP-binding protein [Eggerthellaceae bacterium]
MIIDTETKRKMRDMGYVDLLESLESQDDSAFMSASFEDRMRVAVDNAHQLFTDGKIKRLIKRARLRYDYADIRSVDLAEERKLDRVALMQLATCTFVKTSANVVIEGFTGSGKSFLGCALVKEACRNRMRGYYVRVPDLHVDWETERQKPQGETRLLKKLSTFDCLCIDEWLLDPPEPNFRSFLFELLERRYESTATIFCTQFKQADWHHRLGGGVHADAIMDRVVHGAVWFNSGEVNMRKRLTKEKAAEESN